MVGVRAVGGSDSPRAKSSWMGNLDADAFYGARACAEI